MASSQFLEQIMKSKELGLDYSSRKAYCDFQKEKRNEQTKNIFSSFIYPPSKQVDYQKPTTGLAPLAKTGRRRCHLILRLLSGPTQVSAEKHQVRETIHL